MPPLPPDVAIALPVRFFTETLPAITDLAELRVTLHLYYRVAAGEELVTEADVLADPALRHGLLPLGSARDPAEPLRRGLEQAITRGTLLLVEAVEPAPGQRWYTLNTPASQELLHDLLSGQAERVEIGAAWRAVPVVAPEPTIHRLYERHVATLTPLVAQQLTEAADTYPAAWIADAFDEAVARDRRSWGFIQRLLERWASEGRNDAADRRTTAQPLDPNKYTKGKYAAFFQR
ncbi:MAG: primosomal replication protein N [Chloroflexi bacterium]|nr:primosomal replication protein N [Chloroflexota bacterium]